MYRVADVGIKPLPAQKLLGLLSLVNVRMPSESLEQPPAAKFLGRMSQGTKATGTTTAPSAAAVLLMAMSHLPRAASCKTS